MHRRASHAIFIHHRGFSTFCRECAASQRVAGPYEYGSLNDNDMYSAAIELQCQPTLLEQNMVHLYLQTLLGELPSLWGKELGLSIGGGISMSHVDYKKWLCHSVEFKKRLCRPVDFKKRPCHPVDF